MFWRTRKHTVLPKQNATVKLVLKAMIAALDNAHLTATIQTKKIVAFVIRGICHCKQKYAGDDCSLYVGIKGKGRGPISAESLISAFHMYRYLEDKLNVETKKTSGDKFTQIRLLKEDIEFSARLINARGDDLEKAVREQNVYNPSYVTPGKVEETVADMVAQDRSEREYLIVAETGNSTARTKAEQARAKWRRDTLDILAFGGNDRIPCPHGCSGRGKCVHGLCECKEGWHTADCSERSCPRNCSGHGSCSDGVCECENQWSGPYCSVESTPKCEKTCLASCQKNAAEGDEGSNSRQICIKDCIKKNCHAQKIQHSSCSTNGNDGR